MNTKPKTMNKQVLVLFPEDLKTRFDQACRDRGETPSDVLRRLAETYASTYIPRNDAGYRKTHDPEITEAQWEHLFAKFKKSNADEISHLEQLAEDLGVPGNLKLAAAFHSLERRYQKN